MFKQLQKSMGQKLRIIVGLSGGVDSSVAAWLLKQQGHDVIGLFMKNWEDDDNEVHCSARQDWLDAVSIADTLDIDIEAVNFSQAYKDRVFSVFLSEYAAGRTPNPDILCNSEIKFKAFLDHALCMGADYIATGHYARVQHNASGARLLKAIDVTKDQSYFLHRLTQQQLIKSLFPLGELRKTQVRQIAADLGLCNARKKDSTGICFIGERPFREFLNRYLPTRPGPIKNDQGTILGEHIGLSFYTLGQRKGIGMGGQKNSSGQAWYVACKDLPGNTLYIVQGHDHPWLSHHRLSAEQAHFIDGQSDHWMGHTLTAKTRYRQQDAICRLNMSDTQHFELDFDEPQFAVTPGQSAVLYAKDVCLGGGIISNTQSSGCLKNKP